jgi:hypothetical protein
LGLVVAIPAIAGPLDLGTVVLRAVVDVNPVTAALSVSADPLPQAIDGIPLQIKTVHLDLDRAGFTLNPTSCRPIKIATTLSAASGASLEKTNSFQAADCGNLAFKPRLNLSLSGSTAHGGHPALSATLRYPRGRGANLRRVTVALPGTELLDSSRIRSVCTAPQLASQQCPRNSVYGRAKAFSPLLRGPLEGPVFLSTGSGGRLPDLTVDLEGEIDLVLHGHIGTDPAGGLSATFAKVPDAPISRFELHLDGGQRGLLQNSADICRSPQRALVRLIGQNQRAVSSSPALLARCDER